MITILVLGTVFTIISWLTEFARETVESSIVSIATRRGVSADFAWKIVRRFSPDLGFSAPLLGMTFVITRGVYGLHDLKKHGEHVARECWRDLIDLVVLAWREEVENAYDVVDLASGRRPR